MKVSHSLNIESLPGPQNTRRAELPNGITVLARSSPESQSVVIGGYLANGSLLDPPGLTGLANFTSAALMRGTKTRSFQQIFRALEEVGASLGFGASVHNTSFSGRSLVEDLPLLLELLADCTANPVFPPDYVERLRAQLLTGLAVRDQDTAEMASLTFDSLLFPGHPYGIPEVGYQETVRGITRQQVVDFHRQHYGPRGMVVVVAGGIGTAEAVERVAEALGGWQNPVQAEPEELPPPAHPAEGVRRHVDIAGKSQTNLVMGSPGPKRNSPDYLPASLGNSVLGQFGMMGRIGNVVREQAGLAYNASTSLNGWINGGSWEVSAGVDPANLEKAIGLIETELRRFVSEPVLEEELADSQSNFIGRLPLSLESNAGVAGALLNLERFQLGMDYFQRYPGLVSAVTPPEILQAARKYMDPERLVIASAGSREG